MNKVTRLPCVTTLDIPADIILAAAEGKLAGTTIIGWDKEGELYFASSYASSGDTLMLLEKAKQFLLNL